MELRTIVFNSLNKKSKSAKAEKLNLKIKR